MRAYRHSVGFGSLKQVQETIQDNYTSQQYVEVLDTLLYNAVQPILEASLVGHTVLAQILAWYNTCSVSRKISGCGNRVTIQTLIAMYMMAPSDKRVQVLRRLRLDRNLIAVIIDTFLQHTEKVSWFERLREYPEIVEQLGWDTECDLYSRRRTVLVWYQLYLEFRSYMVEKYTRYALLRAKETYVLVGHALDLDDVVQHYMMAIGKAIDKFDVNKGSLTAYIGQWFLNARTVVRKEISLQFEGLDETHIVLPDVEKVQVDKCKLNIIRTLAKIADPIGLARMSLGIPDPVSDPNEIEFS